MACPLPTSGRNLKENPGPHFGMDLRGIKFWIVARPRVIILLENFIHINIAAIYHWDTP